MITIQKKRTIAIVLGLFLMLPVFSQTNYSELIEKYREKILKAMKKKNIPGASIALVDGDSIVWQEGFGFADEENEMKATPATLYKVGSVTKLFTGSAVMQLQEKGKLNIDKPVNDYIPKLNMKNRFDKKYHFTSRQVLTHHAGLPSDIMKGFFSYKPEKYTTILDYLNNEYLCFPPGMIHSYSNPGFTLMGVMVEEVANESYTDYVGKNIFKPLGMHNTCFWGVDKDVPAMSKTYDRKGKELDAPKLRDVPAGSIWSNVVELSSFIKEMIPENEQNKILKSQTKKEIFSVQNKDVEYDLSDPIGIVWEIIEDTKAGNIYHHGGATMAHRAMVAVAPETGLGLAILTNSSRGYSVLKMYTSILKEAAEVKGIAKNKEDEDDNKDKKKKIETRKLAVNEFNNFEGTYAMPGVIMHFEKKRGKLQTKVQGVKLQLLNVKDNEFLMRVKLLWVIGIKMKKQRMYLSQIDGNKILVQERLSTGSKGIAGLKVEKTKIPGKWKNRIGEYEIINKDDFEFVSDCELKEEDGMLLLEISARLEKKQKLNFGLGIENENLAYVLGLGRHGGQAVRFIKDDEGKEIMYYSGYKFKKSE